MKHLKRFKEGKDSDFTSEVKDIFSYVLDAYDSEVQNNNSGTGVTFTFLFDFHDDYKELIEGLKVEVEECLDKLSITNSFYYKTAYGVRGGSNRPVYMITFNDGSENSVYSNIYLQDYKYIRKI